MSGTLQGLQALYDAHQGNMSAVAGKPMALDYGDFAGEVAAIEEAVGLLPMEACAVLLVRGPDAEVFLTGLTSNDVNGLAQGAAGHNLLCATKGKILHHVIVLRTKPEEFLILTEPGDGDPVAHYLDHYHVREDLQLGMVELLRLDLLGPGTPQALRQLGISPDTAAGEFAGGPLLAPRLDVGALSRALVLLPAPNAPELAQTLLAQEPPARLVGMHAFDEARLWAGVPRFAIDYGQDHLPAEAALYDHISFNKGCYVGQEIHARMHYRGHPNRKLATVDLPEAAAQGLAVGDELFLDGKSVGKLTGLSRLSRQGLRRGIAMLRYQELQQWPRLALDAQGAADVATRPLASDLGVSGVGAAPP